MKNIARYLATVVVLLLGLPVSVLSFGEGKATKPKLSVVPSSPSVVLGQPILVEMIIENATPDVWTVDWGGYRSRNVRLKVSEPGVSSQDLMREFTRKPASLDEISVVTLGGPATLESGAQLRRTLVLSSWFDFDKVGMYGVVVRVPAERGQSGVRDTLEADLEVEVRGADPEALAETCSDLAEAAIHGSVDSSFKAGEALSHVRDEICLPSLAHVLSEDSSVKNDVVIALAEMGSEKAISVLVAQWEALSEGVRARAKYEFWIRDRANELETALATHGRGDPSPQGESPEEGDPPISKDRFSPALRGEEDEALLIFSQALTSSVKDQA